MLKNIVKDIEQNCPDCECSPERTVEFLKDRGDFSYISEYHREIWFFYLEALKTRTKREAREVTIELFKISEGLFRKVRRKYRATTS